MQELKQHLGNNLKSGEKNMAAFDSSVGWFPLHTASLDLLSLGHAALQAYL